MTNQQEPSYEELKRRLDAAESSLRAIQKAQGSRENDEGPSIVEQLTEAKAREAHIKQVLLAIRDVNQLIVREHDRQRLLQGACDLLTKTRGYHSAWIALFDAEQEISMVFEAGIGASFSAMRERLREGHRPPCMDRAVAAAGHVVVQDPNEACTYCPIREAQAALRGMSVVMNHEGRIYGSLCVALSPTLAEDEEEQTLLREVADDLGFALHTIEIEEARAQAVEELRTSEETLRLIFENAFDGISIHEETPDTEARRLVDCNKRYAEMAGRSKEELLNTQNTTLFQKKRELPRSAVENRRLREGKIPYRGTFSWIRPDNEENIIEYTAVPIDVNGRPLTIGIDRDITEKVKAMTEREEALAALAENRRRLSTLMRNLPGMAYRCLNEPGRPMSFVSEGCRDLTGYTPTEIKNPEYPHYGDLIHPADQQRVWDTIQEAVEAGAPYVLEYRIRTKEDEERWVWERGRVIPQQDSASIYLEGFISDITERKLAEEDLRLFKAIVENSNEAIAISDPEGMLVYINEAHTTLFGRTLEEARQANYRDFYPPASIEILNHEVVPALERGESWEGELDAYDATGRRFPLWERADSIQDAEGNLRLAFGLMHDVSEQRDMELQREAMLEALRESEEKYRTLFEEALTPILLVDEGGHYVDANKAAFEFLECEREELLGQTVWDFSPPDRMEQQQQEHAPFVERRTLETDYWVRGAIKTLLLNVVPLEMDGQTILYGIGQDITARKRTEAQRKAALEAVRESEARYRTLFESANDAIFIMEGDTFIDCNDATVQIFGCEDKNDILNHTPAQFSPPTQPDGRDSGEKALAHIQAALNSKGQHFEWRHTRKDGTPFDSEVSLNRLQIDDTIYLQAIVRDITERKQAEAQRKAALEALRESEEKYRLLFESADVLVSVYDRDGICRLMNQKVASLFGGKPEDLIGRSFRELHPGAGDLYLQRIRHAIDTGHANEYEDRVTFPTGDRWLLTSVHPVPDAQGLLKTAQIVSQDITERKEAEEERIRLANQIREQARQMAHILETVPAGVLLLDPEGRIIEANPVAEDTLAVLAEIETGDILTHLGGRPLDELLTSPPTRGLWHEVKAEAPLGDRTFEVIARPVENGPEPEQWVMVINEVTQEREIRAQLQRQEQLAAVGQLAAGIAHDFNNIMAVIVLYTQMGLRAPGLPSGIRERLKVIDQQAKRATDLIQQILDFGGRAILERRPMDLVPFLKETVRLLQRTIPEHVTVNLTFGLDSYTIDGDPTRMQQMLTNLAVNARDAMPNGGEFRIELAKITVEPGQTPPVPEMRPGPWVKLTVSDTGVGMSDEVLLHLYEPFYTTKEPGEGTGLGLAQVHGIVNQHGGAIDVETEVGAGTTFTIYLPALETEAAEPAPQIAPPASQGHGQMVLVVEDEPTVRAALVESLEAWHYQTMEAANGEEALAALDAHANRIDVILSDVVMPAMGGIALFHAMRERGLSIPVVMLSGHPMESELKDLQAQGLAGWMLKPPDMKRLSRLLIQALQRDKSQ